MIAPPHIIFYQTNQNIPNELVSINPISSQHANLISEKGIIPSINQILFKNESALNV